MVSLLTDSPKDTVFNVMSLDDDRHFSESKRHISEGEARIKQQVNLIQKMAREGHNTTRAVGLLYSLQQMLDVMKEHHQILLAEQRTELAAELVSVPRRAAGV